MKNTSHTRAVRFLSGLFYFFSIFIFINAFDLAHNPQSGWENQFLPDLNGRIISDMCFTDSLNGYATAYKKFDPNYILRTTNGGINWIVSDSLVSWLTKVQFLDMKIGYVCGARMYKTTNAGNNWFQINLPGEAGAIDMSVINEDTIWITDDEGLTGGIFLTTNGGGNWTRKYYGGGFTNPEKIYFANSRLGFASRALNNYLRTSDGGETWQIINGPSIWFNDMKFIDSLTGYKANGYIMKTIDGGLNWNQQTLPPTGDTISSNSVERISNPLNSEIIYGVGPRAFYFNPNLRGLIFKTTDFGNSWGYQLPDTSLIRFRKYSFTEFVNEKRGWAYQINTGGIYTELGGDTTIYTGIRNISSEIPENFMLYQNYPNPFNPKTNVKFEVKRKARIDISVYDVSGRSVAVLVSGELQSGTYETVFEGSALSSGIYFCVMQSSSFRETIAMMFLK